MSRIRKTLDAIQARVLKWRIAIYIRLSKEDGNDESYSVTNQRERLTDLFDELKMEEDVELVDFYIDDGCTGITSDREDFQRMLDDIDSKRVNCVIVKDLSRLSRNDWECKRYLQHLFVILGVRFISLELPSLDSFKRPEEVYSINVSFQSMSNENHCYETSIKVRGTLNKKMEKGDYIGAFAPYGYLKDPLDRHHLVVNPETAPVVRDIYNWFVFDGLSKQAITKRLIELGIPSPATYKQQKGMKYHSPHAKNGGLWSHRTVDMILRNEVYLGHVLQGKHKVLSYKVQKIVQVDKSKWKRKENKHEPIIDKAVFDLAQDLMKRDTRTAPEQKKVYTFSGYLKCADCGKGMTRTASKGYIYYACKTYVHKSHNLCTRHTLKGSELENTVLEAIRKQIDLLDGLSQMIDEINKSPTVRTSSVRIEALLKLRKQDLDKVIKLKDGLYLDWKSGDITKEEYHRMKQGFEQKEQELLQNIENLQEEQEDMTQGVTSDNPYLTTFLKHKNIQNLDRGIVVELIKMVHVHEGGDLTIDFNFADQHRRIAEFIENNSKELTVITNTAQAV